MRTLSAENFERARDFVQKQARPVDQTLFAYTFEEGEPEAVWDALRAFANEDGGFGHGMEPDLRLPASSMLGTITALPYLLQTNAPVDHPLVENGIRFLINGYDQNLKGWRIIPPEANDYPRAMWWHYDPEKADQNVIDNWGNPSACAVAYLQRYASLVPDDFLREVTDKAMTELRAKKDAIDGQTFLTYVELAEELPAELSAPMWEMLKRRAHAAIVTDPAEWSGYGIRPLCAVSDPSSPLMEPLGEAVNAHLDFEIDHQEADGSWHPFWNWGRYEDEWKTAKVEWQGQMTVKLLRSFKAFGRIDSA